MPGPDWRDLGSLGRLSSPAIRIRSDLQWITGVYCGGYLLVRRAASAAVTAPRRHITTPAICTEFQSTAASTNGPILNARRRKPGDPGGGMASLNCPMDHLTTIALRPEDLDFLSAQVSDPDLHTRNVERLRQQSDARPRVLGNRRAAVPASGAGAVRAADGNPDEPQRGPRHVGRWHDAASQSAAGQRRDRPAGARCGRQHDQHAEPVWHQPVPDVLRPVLRPRPRFLRPRRRPRPGPDRRHGRAARGSPAPPQRRSAAARASTRPARPDRQPPRAAREQPAAFRIPDRQPRRPFRSPMPTAASWSTPTARRC